MQCSHCGKANGVAWPVSMSLVLVSCVVALGMSAALALLFSSAALFFATPVFWAVAYLALLGQYLDRSKMPFA
jgi:hypothetical protein